MSVFEVAHAPLEREPWRRIAAGGGFLVVVVGVAIGLAAIAALPLWAASVVVTLVTGGVLWRFYRHTAAGRFGLANWVTLFRLNLVALLLLAAWPGEVGSLEAWALFVIAAIALLLDGVDGWLARRRKEASDFGERFDMGADTAFTIILTFCLVAFALVGPWVLLIGLLRPAFVLAARRWPILNSPLPPSRIRKALCAGSLACLVAGLAPPLAPFAPALALASLLQLLWSFGRDLAYLTRHKGTVRSFDGHPDHP